MNSVKGYIIITVGNNRDTFTNTKERVSRLKILIIEDEKLLADSLKLMLESKGFEAEAVYDGDSGEQYAMLNIYDLIILDIMLPIKN